MLKGLFGKYFEESEAIESLQLSDEEADAELASPNSIQKEKEEAIRRELKPFKLVVCNQYGNYALKSLFKNTSNVFKSKFSKYIFRIKKHDPDLFTQYYGSLRSHQASHFFNFFKKTTKA